MRKGKRILKSKNKRYKTRASLEKRVGKLKRTSEGTLYSPKTKTEYVREGDYYKMVPDKWLLKELNNDLARLRRLNKKTGGLESDIEYVKYLRSEYRQKVKEFNEGKIARPETVSKTEKQIESEIIHDADYFSSENKSKYMKDLSVKNRTQYARYMGVHNVRNEKAYETIVTEGAKLSGMTREEFEGVMFPTGYNEISSYEDYKQWKEKNEQSIKNIFNSRVEEGEITRAEAKQFLKEVGYV